MPYTYLGLISPKALELLLLHSPRTPGHVWQPEYHMLAALFSPCPGLHINTLPTWTASLQHAGCRVRKLMLQDGNSLLAMHPSSGCDMMHTNGP